MSAVKRSDAASELESPDKHQELLRQANMAFEKSTDWVAFFRRMLGVNGAAYDLLNTPEEANDFQQSVEFRAIQQMVAKLRQKRRRKKDKNTDREPTKVITVRMPKSLHELLRDQAGQHGISINQLCISKLLQMVDDELIP